MALTRKLVFPVSGSPKRLIFKGTKSESLWSWWLWWQERGVTFLDAIKLPSTVAEGGEGTAVVRTRDNIRYLIRFPREHVRSLSQKQQMQRRRIKTRRWTLSLIRLSLTILGQIWVIISHWMASNRLLCLFSHRKEKAWLTLCSHIFKTFG